MHRRRAEIQCIVFLCYFLIAIPRVAHTDSAEQVIEWIEPATCLSTKNEYFHTDFMKCKTCSNDLVPSNDGYGCVCNKNSKNVAMKDGNPVCVGCEEGKIRTNDGYECISCDKRADDGFCGCSGNEITIERSWNGTILETQRCLPCPKNTYSSIDRKQCLPCWSASFTDDRDDWSLDDPSRNSLRKYCMPRDSPKDWPDVQNTYAVKYKNKKISVDSYYFRAELRFTFYSCERGNGKACVQLANMCSLTLFDVNAVACKFFTHKNEANSRIKLFYREDEARGILNRRTIAQRYTLDRSDPASNRLKLVVASFGPRGRFETIGEPNLPCPFFRNLPFGVNLLKRCTVTANELTNGKMAFFVPYLSHLGASNGDKRLLHPLPVFIKNINEHVDQDDRANWKLVGRFFSIDRMTGYRAISNSKNASFTRGSELQVLRYIKSLSIVVKLQERSERGKIFPPLLVVEYDELTNQEIIENIELSVEYRVTYGLSDDETNGAIEICIGIFSGLAVAYSAINAWSNSRRSCKNLASISTIIWFIVNCFGAIGNILLAICSCSCVYTFVFYKGQKVVHILLPNRSNEWTIRVCIVIAFASKIIEILVLLHRQRSINIFFIDWEQPRIINDATRRVEKFNSPPTFLGGYSRSADKFYSPGEPRACARTASEIIGARRKKISSPSRSASRASASSGRESNDDETSNDLRFPIEPSAAILCHEGNFFIDDNCEEKNSSVSVWRTCVVANEWLRIRTARKINILLQTVATLFILEIIGGKYWSKTIPELSLEPDETLSIDESFTLEYAVGILTYLVVYTAQWFFSVFIYERYVKNQLQEFVDLCSMANISVFILSHDFYGYYIHGRSVHGFADTDLLTLINDLKREENNLCAHRGLIPGTTEQTFVISISKTFRTFYERLLGSQNSSGEKFLRRNISNVPADWDERWKTHLRLRKFFTGFLDHCYRNVDYTIKERHCLEKMFDLEITDIDEKSIFYIDNAYSFDRTIFYGNEWTLATFEINVFLLVLVFDGNYILASVAALLAAKAISAIAGFKGKQLLADKTFIDERFLVSR